LMIWKALMCYTKVRDSDLVVCFGWLKMVEHCFRVCFALGFGLRVALSLFATGCTSSNTHPSIFLFLQQRQLHPTASNLTFAFKFNREPMNHATTNANRNRTTSGRNPNNSIRPSRFSVFICLVRFVFRANRRWWSSCRDRWNPPFSEGTFCS
jgi:hypothetical protein